MNGRTIRQQIRDQLSKRQRWKLRVEDPSCMNSNWPQSQSTFSSYHQTKLMLLQVFDSSIYMYSPHSVDDILRPKYAIVLKLNKDMNSFTSLYHARLPSVPNERCTFGGTFMSFVSTELNVAINTKREMLCTSRYANMRGSGNMLSLYKVQNTIINFAKCCKGEWQEIRGCCSSLR